MKTEKIKKKAKQIKSFTVDGEVYSSLVESLKEAGESSFTISSLVNDYLGYLHFWIKGILAVYEKNKTDIDKGWVINEIIKEVYDSPNKIFPMDEPWVKEHLESHTSYLAYNLLGKYNAEKKKFLDAPIWKKIYGTCDQCKYNHGGVCSIKNGTVGYMERCNRFKLHESVNPKDLIVGEILVKTGGHVNKKKKGKPI